MPSKYVSKDRHLISTTVYAVTAVKATTHAAAGHTKENGGVREDSAVPARAILPTDPRSSAWQPHRSVHPLDPVARVAMSLRASLYGIPASTRYRLTMNLATNRRAQRRDRTNVYICHLDHLDRKSVV